MRRRRGAFLSNEKTGLWYELQGDYYLPCLKLPEESEVHIGIWGQRHLRYLKQYHRARYDNLLTSGKLNDYLVDVKTWARQMFNELVNALSRNENLTEDFTRRLIRWNGLGKAITSVIGRMKSSMWKWFFYKDPWLAEEHPQAIF